MDPVANLERVLGDARALVDAVSYADLAIQTPCSGWSVRALTAKLNIAPAVDRRVKTPFSAAMIWRAPALVGVRYTSRDPMRR